MTHVLSGKEISSKLSEFGDFTEINDVSVWIPKEDVLPICDFLKNDFCDTCSNLSTNINHIINEY